MVIFLHCLSHLSKDTSFVPVLNSAGHSLLVFMHRKPPCLAELFSIFYKTEKLS